VWIVLQVVHALVTLLRLAFAHYLDGLNVLTTLLLLRMSLAFLALLVLVPQILLSKESLKASSATTLCPIQLWLTTPLRVLHRT
jgi:hypothetical protein